jgi:hypothetical protein
MTGMLEARDLAALHCGSLPLLNVPLPSDPLSQITPVVEEAIRRPVRITVNPFLLITIEDIRAVSRVLAGIRARVSKQVLTVGREFLLYLYIVSSGFHVASM